jgi:hypothetical protein
MVFAPADPVTRARHVTHAIATPIRIRVDLTAPPPRVMLSIIVLGSLLMVPIA